MEKKKNKDGRGGARAGAGRKSPGFETTTVTLRLPEQVAAVLRSTAKSRGVPIWKVIADALGVDVDNQK